MSDGLLFVLASLATWRVVRLIQTDTVTLRPREKLYDRFPPTPERATLRSRWNRDLGDVVHSPRSNVRRPSWFGRLISCPWCASVWLAGILVVVLDLMRGLELPGLWWAAVAAAAGLIGRLDGNGS